VPSGSGERGIKAESDMTGSDRLHARIGSDSGSDPRCSYQKHRLATKRRWKYSPLKSCLMNHGELIRNQPAHIRNFNLTIEYTHSIRIAVVQFNIL